MLGSNNKRDVTTFGMLPALANAIAEALKASQEQLINLQQLKNKPHVLDDAIVNRIIKSHTKQNKSIENEKILCLQWKQQELTVVQYKIIEEIWANLLEMEKTNQQILFLAEHYKNHTIDKMLSMEEAELAQAYLSGKLY